MTYKTINNNFTFLFVRQYDRSNILSAFLLKRKFGIKGNFSFGIGKILWKKSRQFFNYGYNKLLNAVGFVFHKNAKLFEYCIDTANLVFMIKICNKITTFLLKVDFRTLIYAVINYSRYENHIFYIQISLYTLATTIATLYWSGVVVESEVLHMNVLYESLNAIGTKKTHYIYTSEELKISIDYLMNFSQNAEIQQTVKAMTRIYSDTKLNASNLQIKIKPLVEEFNTEYESIIEKNFWFYRIAFKICFFLLLLFILSQLNEVPNDAFIEEVLSPMNSESSSWETVSNSSEGSD